MPEKKFSKRFVQNQLCYRIGWFAVAVQEDAEKLLSWLKQESVDYKVADDEESAERLWEVRRLGSSSMKKLAPN